MNGLLIAGISALALTVLGAAPAGAQNRGNAPVAAKQKTADASVARKHRGAKVTVRRHLRWGWFYDPLEVNRSLGFVGAYPGEYAWRRSLGQTVCDLGYGRWDSCEPN
jgi:hypothetical protein